MVARCPVPTEIDINTARGLFLFAVRPKNIVLSIGTIFKPELAVAQYLIAWNHLLPSMKC
jgi:hypothetical protein